MNDDIVTRLREITAPGKWQSMGKWDATANEAADKIERLRAEIAAQASVIDALREELRAAEEQVEFWKRRALRNAAYLRRIEQGEI